MKRALTIFSGSPKEKDTISLSEDISSLLGVQTKTLSFSNDFEDVSGFAFSVASSSEGVYNEFKKAYEHEHLTKLRKIEKLFNEITNNDSKLNHETGDICDVASSISRYYDLVIINSNIEKHTEEYLGIINALIFETGTPILLNPDGIEKKSLDNILIAWDGSVRASRAVKDAMPIIEKAKEIKVVGVNESEKDVASAEQLLEYLKTYNVDAKHLGVKKLNFCVGKTILDEAEKQKSNLIVMGAYTRPKIRQAILGGATKYMLNHTKIPVLMAH